MSLLKWLIETAGCPWDALACAREAIEFDFCRSLVYIYEQIGGFSGEQLTELLQHAGAERRIFYSVPPECCEWLRNQGAEWPNPLGYVNEETNTYVSWEGYELAWALKQGCTSQLMQDVIEVASQDRGDDSDQTFEETDTDADEIADW